MTQPARHLLATALVLIAAASPAAAVVKTDYTPGQVDKRVDVMQRVVMIRYTRLGVCGGSGVVVGPRHVLTAKHGALGWSAAQLKVDPDGANKQWVAVDRVIKHPEESVDLAVLRLAEPLDFQPVTLLDRVPRVGERVWLGGFGVYGGPGEPAGFGRFHMGFNQVTQVDSGLAKVVLDRDGEASEALPAAVDSGSPVWIETPDGWALAGITIRATNIHKPSFGDSSQHQVVAPVRQWLKAVAQPATSGKAAPRDASDDSR